MKNQNILSGSRFLFIFSIYILLNGGVLAQGKSNSTKAPYSIYLIGDAGADTAKSTALHLLESQLNKDANSTVLFLGDNIYPKGLIGKDSTYKKHSDKKLISQLSTLNNYKGSAYFIPGNHDWKAGKWKGLEIVKRQELFVNDYMKTRTKTQNKLSGSFYPTEGQPGPVSIDLNDDIQLIIFDSQWWLQSQMGHPVGFYAGKNKEETAEIFFNRLDSLLKEAGAQNKIIILATHHPLFSSGVHASKKTGLRFLINYTPAQLFGVLGVNRYLTQNMNQPRYRKWKNKMLDILTAHKNVFFVSGHEHNMQYTRSEKNFFIISGAGSKIEKFNKIPTKPGLYFDKQLGLVKLIVHSRKRITIEIWDADKREILKTVPLDLF